MKTRLIILVLLALFLIAFVAQTGTSVPIDLPQSLKGYSFESNRHDPAYPSRNNARTLPPASGRVGIKRSAYTGRWFVKAHEPIRRCIVRRESNGYYGVENATSSAAGAYQMLASTSNWVARQIHRPDLINKPASKWSRWEQDKGFWRLWAKGSGRGHWAGGNWACF